MQSGSGLVRRLFFKLAVACTSPLLLTIWFVLDNARIFISSKHKRKIIVIRHRIFDYEVDNLPAHPDIVFVSLSARACKTIFSRFIPEDSGITDFNYLDQIKKYPEQQQSLYVFWYTFLLYLKRMQLIDCMFSANYVYLLQMELNRACVDHLIKFVVLFKESITPSSQLHAQFTKLYRKNKFLGSHMLVYEENVKEYMLNVPGVHPEKLEVVGFPRLDRYMKYAENNYRCVKNNAVTLFWSSVSEKMFLFDDKNEIAIASATERLYEKYIVSAELLSDICFNIKFKLSNHRAQLEVLLEKLGRRLPNNVVLHFYGDPYELEIESDVILGFNSTCLFEGLALRKPIVEPYIPLGSVEGDGYLDSFPKAAIRPRNLEELVEVFRRPEKHVASEEVREEVLRYYFTYLDGCSGERVNRALLKAAS